MDNRIAIIDLGTNTFHLLIADKENDSIIHRDQLVVKIGQHGINRGILTPAGMERGLAAIQQFKSAIDHFAVEKVIAFGTSALRNATNVSEFINKIRLSTGIQIELITGMQEAEYIYQGVRSAVKLGGDNSLIIDIGGGSVEFIIGNNDQILWMESVEIGGQRLLEQFQKHDPISPGEIANLNSHFKETLTSLFKQLERFHPTLMVGSSGSYDTLSEIYCIRKGIPVQPLSPETPLTTSGVYELYEELITMNRDERMKIPGMVEMRVDMIVVGVCLIKFLLDTGNFTEIKVSSFSLKEGVLASLMSER